MKRAAPVLHIASLPPPIHQVLEWDPRRAFRMDKYIIEDVEDLALGR